MRPVVEDNRETSHCLAGVGGDGWFKLWAALGDHRLASPSCLCVHAIENGQSRGIAAVLAQVLIVAFRSCGGRVSKWPMFGGDVESR